MASKLSKTVGKKSLRPVRSFSETVKRQAVKDIEEGKCSVLEVSRELSVSFQSVYLWVYKYSGYLHKNKVMVVQNVSEAYKTKILETKLLEAQAALGRKQMEIDILNKLIELAGAELQVDIKKNFSNLASSGSVQTRE